MAHKGLSWDLNSGTRVYAILSPPLARGGHPAHFTGREAGIHSLSQRRSHERQKGGLKLGCLLPVLHVTSPASLAALRTQATRGPVVCPLAGQDTGALTSGTKMKGSPKTSVIKINNRYEMFLKMK